MIWKLSISIRSNQLWIPVSRYRDEAIMDGIIRVAKARRGTVNQVHIYLRVNFLSDIVSEGKIDLSLFNVERRCDT